MELSPPPLGLQVVRWAQAQPEVPPEVPPEVLVEVPPEVLLEEQLVAVLGELAWRTAREVRTVRCRDD